MNRGQSFRLYVCFCSTEQSIKNTFKNIGLQQKTLQQLLWLG